MKKSITSFFSPSVRPRETEQNGGVGSTNLKNATSIGTNKALTSTTSLGTTPSIKGAGSYWPMGTRLEDALPKK